ncbi:GGDEF domain-containing protein [Mangrovicella endophytica]|uniref:GGDEF domain-containing protein n=1 Tax=Mangrovicella endophytica TaxID=2066697 RepID=UPI0018E4C410|nr:diguanylate cyclase [Mangrovicella endophytica]
MTYQPAIAIALLHGLGIMALVAVCYGCVERLPLHLVPKRLLEGLIFGGGAVAAMLSPALLWEGVIIDARSVIVGMAGAFAGPAVTLIAGLLASAYRLWLGGAGAPVGVSGIVFAAVVGLWWGRGKRRGQDASVLDLALLGAFVSLHMVTFLFLPIFPRTGAATQIWLTVMISYVAASIVMGSMMRRERMMLLRERGLRHDALTDVLTGLANRRAFEETLSQKLSLLQTTQEAAISLLLIDIDHFKNVNDRFGHDTGDEALKTVARVLRACVRDGDLVARHGGEEFAVLLPLTSQQAATKVAERIRMEIEATPFDHLDTAFGLTVSIGLASSEQHGTDALGLRTMADAALYAAKRAGRNRVVGPVPQVKGGPDESVAFDLAPAE